MERTRKSSVLFLVMVGIAIYVLVSGAIAVATVDDCGDDDAQKSWVLLPPQWKCGADETVLLVP